MPINQHYSETLISRNKPYKEKEQEIFANEKPIKSQARFGK